MLRRASASIAVLALAPCACADEASNPPMAGNVTIADAGTPPAKTSSPISGQVVDREGVPVARASVIVDDRLVLTDAAGAFSFAYVPPVYGIVVVLPPTDPVRWPNGYLVEAVDDVKTRTPTFALSIAQTPARSAVVRPSLTESAGVGYAIAATPAGSGVVPVTMSFPGGSARRLHWRGAARATAHFEIVRYDAALSGEPLRFTGYATVDVDVANGDDVTVPVVLAPPTFGTRVAAAEIDAPSGYQPSLSCGVKIGSTWFAYMTIPGPAGGGTMLVPDLPGATFALFARAYVRGETLHNRTAWGALATLGPKIVLESPVPLEAPDDGAVVSPWTGLAWSGTDDPVSIVMDPMGDGPSYVIHAWRGHTDIPDARRAGVFLRGDVPYIWFINHAHGTPDPQSLAAIGLLGASSGPWSQSSFRRLTITNP